MKEGDEIIVTPTELVAGGASISRVNGFPIFAFNAYPGDVVRLRITEMKKGFGRGEVVAIESPSPLRRSAPCPVAETCGGCDWTALRLDAQLRAKERILTESLRRIGKIDPATLPPIRIHPSPLNYRIRSRLHRQGDAIGFYALRSHDVVPLPPECEVVGPVTARVVGGGAAPPDWPAEVEVWEVDGALVAGPHELTVHDYRVDTESFFQVNRHLLDTLLDLVRAIAAGTPSKHHAIDLYAGIGFFSRVLADVFERVTAVEGAAASHRASAANVPRHVTRVHAPVEAWVADIKRADFIFLDPPRSGTRRNVIDAIAAKARERVCFLACDPVTFARDASRLIASGWRLASLDLVDLFPNTHHVETLSSFERAR